MLGKNMKEKANVFHVGGGGLDNLVPTILLRQ